MKTKTKDIKQPSKLDLYNRDVLRQKFHYRDDGKLIWKDDGKEPNLPVGSHFKTAKRSPQVRVSKEEFEQNSYQISKMIYVYHNGTLPKELSKSKVTHINKDPTDTRIENLRITAHKKA